MTIRRFDRFLAARLALSLPLAFLPPLAAYYLLRSNGPLAALLVYVAAVEGLFLLRRLLSRRLLVTVILCVVLAAGAAAVLVALDITPASAFLAWFRLVRGGQGGGTIGYMFSSDFAFFSSLFAGLLLGGQVILSLLGLLFTGALLVGVIMQNTPLIVAAIVLVVLFLGYSALRQAGRLRSMPLVGAIEVLLAAGLLSLAFTPLRVHNAIVDAFFRADFQGPVSRLFPGFPFLYNVPGYGHSFSNSDLGGRPALTSRPVFEVTASPGETIYLRTAAYNLYTGTGWALSEGLEKQAKPKATGEGTGPIEVRPSSEKRRPLSPVRIKILIDFFASLPDTLNTVSIHPDHGAFPPLSYGSPATGYLLSVPIEHGFVLTDRRASAVRGAAGARLSDRKEYLQTGSVPTRLADLAERLKRSTPRETVHAIQTYLSNNYHYSLNTRRFRSHTNAVADFLFRSKTGYCVQFASALTLLARIDGIPARYVTGFLVNMPPDSNTTTVTGLSAHSWSEVWFAGEGWTTVEATPPMMSSSLTEPSYYRRFNPTDSSFTERQLRAIMGARVQPPQQPMGAPFRLPVVPLLALAAALLASLLLVRGAILIALPLPARVKRLARKLLRRTDVLQIPRPGCGGWYQWASEVGALTGRPAASRRAATIILELFFGRRRVGRREARYLRRLFRLVRGTRRRSRKG